MGVLTTLILLVLGAGAAQATDPALNDIVKKIGEYVAEYGEKTSAIVGVEKYTQVVTLEGQGRFKPKRLVAEFAIVRAGSGWTSFRDVIEVDGKKVEDRKDRLERLLAEVTGSEADLMRIASENSRYNVGPISRNFSVPTAALFFFQPANLARFTFTRKGTKKIEGVEAVELEFTETQRPTLVMRRDGADVPMAGSLWVVPADGTVVWTRLRLKNFTDTLATPGRQAPGVSGPINDKVASGGKPMKSAGLDSLSSQDRETNADIEVTYKKSQKIGIWLPSEMSAQYQGPIYAPQIGIWLPSDWLPSEMSEQSPAPIPSLKALTEGRSSTKASYSGFKQFGTGAAIKK